VADHLRVKSNIMDVRLSSGR